MSTVSEIAQAAAELSLEEQRLLLTTLSAQVREVECRNTGKQRIPGLHRGMVWIADDFDDPLPDDWFTEDVSTGEDPADEEFLKKLEQP
jgi:hypothetical protein